jgi:molybdate transport system substrate-binding protein
LATLHVLSAGAAQAITECMIESFERETPHRVVAEFGAVGAIKSKVDSGANVDVITLTASMIAELMTANVIAAGSKLDLGTVGTGVAVRAGDARPQLSSANALVATLRGASTIVCPDPAIATAGKIVMAMLERLDVVKELSARLQFFPNGYTAMKWLAQSERENALGITQITEIVANAGVVYAGPLPDVFQMKTIYSMGLASHAPEPTVAKAFIARFAAPSARRLLIEAGYELAA